MGKRNSIFSLPVLGANSRRASSHALESSLALATPLSLPPPPTLPHPHPASGSRRVRSRTSSAVSLQYWSLVAANCVSHYLSVSDFAYCNTFQCANCSNLKRDLSLIDIFCPRCTTHYCSFSCEAEHASIHQRFCRPMLPDNVQGFELSCRDDEDPIRSVEIHSRDEIHSRGEICPLSRYIDIPLVMYRHLKQNSMTMTYNPELDNRLASSLMVVPDSGYVIPKWQQNVGLVTVMREDHKPLKLKTLSMILAYCQVVMSVVGGGGGLKDPISPANFLKFCRIYDCEGKGRIYKLRSRFKKIEL